MDVCCFINGVYMGLGNKMVMELMDGVVDLVHSFVRSLSRLRTYIFVFLDDRTIGLFLL